MHSVLSLSMGYVLGSVSPAKLVSSRRHVDLEHSGTGNLGATNTFLVLGKAAAVVVMLFDIFKAWLAMRLAGIFFPMTRLAPLSAGLGAMLGHDYSLFLKFRGGKGLAAFGGILLAFDPRVFGGLLSLGILMMLIFNYGVAATVSAALVFPGVVWYRNQDPGQTAMAAVISAVLLFQHRENLKKCWDGTEIPMRDYLKEKLCAKIAGR